MNKYRLLIGKDCTYRVRVNPNFANKISGFVNRCGSAYFGYREDGGVIVTEKGEVEFKGKWESYNNFFHSNRAYIVFSVLGEKDGNRIVTTGKPKICLFPTKEEKQFLQKLKAPIIYTDPELGDFNAEYGRETLEKRMTYGELDINVRLESKKCLDDFKKIYNELSAWMDRALDFAINNMLSSAHDWQEENEKPICEEEFRERMELISINISNDGFEFAYYTDNIFTDHIIVLTGDFEQGFTSADIEG